MIKDYLLIGFFLTGTLYSTGHDDQEAVLVACSCSRIFPLAYHKDLFSRKTIVLKQLQKILSENVCNYPRCWYRSQALISIEKVVNDRQQDERKN